MKKDSIAIARIEENAASTGQKWGWGKWLLLLIYPLGLVYLWRQKSNLTLKLIYTTLGLPVFLAIAGYIAIVLFSAFLPELDRTVGHRPDKTIYNRAGNYSASFIQTGYETGNQYELVQVELEPHGGNDWHYHTSFQEQFIVVEGQVNIGRNGNVVVLKKGDSTVADKKDMHYFKNALNEKSVLLVKTMPAAGLEKTLRVAYGLINDGLLKNDMTENPWHMCLLLAYSESYLKGLPTWFQEPLINALAKIAQWKGEDRDLYKYFK